MRKKLLWTALVGGATFFLLTGGALALEKLKFATPIKLGPWYYLPILAAEEKGYWKENGLEVEWVPIGTSAGMYHAIAAGSVSVGGDAAAGLVPAVARGVPIVIVSNRQKNLATALWVRADSPVSKPKDLKKGARVGIVSMGGVDHAYGRMLLRALGMEKDVRFVATGGIPNSMAALKAGVMDATAMIRPLMAPLEARGEVRAVAMQEDYIKIELLGHINWARKDFLKTSPETVAKAIKATLQAADFVRKNPDWAIEKIKSEQGLPPAAAESIYKGLDFSTDGRVSREALENTRNFLVEYEVIPKDKVPSIDDLYTRQFTG